MNYYDDIEARYQIEPALLDELRKLNVMYDRDESGEFLHFYTQPIGTVFLEVVERRDGYAVWRARRSRPTRCSVPASLRRKSGARDPTRRRLLRFVLEFTSDQREHWMSPCGRCRTRSRNCA